MSVGEIVKLFPGRPQEQLNFLTETNQSISERHTQGITQFVEDTPNWALPAIVLAVDKANLNADGKIPWTSRKPMHGNGLRWTG